MPGSGIFKSTDGGTTWSQLSNGLPAHIGRAEVAVAPSNSQVVYAYADVEAKGDDAGALYRSDDAGAHFTRVNDADEIAQRGDDLVSLAVDPRDPQTVYLTNTSTYRSTDGGRTLVAIKGAPGGDDYHTVWINPRDPRIIALASDQGATISVDGGATWSSWYNQPTAQMYHVNADNRFPYWICGGQQESGSACVLSRGDWGETTERDWHPVGAQEYGYVVPDPLHHGVFFGGKVEKFDERTGQTQEVSPIALPSKQFRTVRTEPLAFDPLDQRRLYFGSNVVFATDNGGQSWHAISPDLTRAHPGVPPVLGAFESDDPQQGNHRGVVYAIAPSHVHKGTIWAGTDDGLIWITRDRPSTGSGQAHWKNITPPELTPWSKIAQIDASRFDDQTAFVAVNRFRLDDLRPYVYVTHDGGAYVAARRQRPAQLPGERGAPRSRRTATALRGHGERRLRLVRFGRELAIAPARSSAYLRSRSDRASKRRGRRNAWTRLLDSRRSRTVARAGALDGARRASLYAGARLSRAARDEHRYAAAARRANRRESARRRHHRLRARLAGAARRHFDLR